MTRVLAPRVTLAALLIAAAVGLAGCGSAKPAARPSYPGVLVTIGSHPIGAPLAPGFLGLSVEYSAVPAYDRPALIRLIRDLSPGQRPVLRIGGNSTDEAWWPQRGEIPPRGAVYPLSDSWLKTTKALASALDAKLIMGLNLAGGSPVAASIEARAFLRGIGRQYIQAFEIGNEPDLYGLFPWPQDRRVYRRPASYGLSDYIREFSSWRAALGRQLPIAGPAFATFDWALGRFIDAEPGLAQTTFHHYALDACLTKPSAPGYPTVASLLSNQASRGLAERLVASVRVAHARHVRFRLDELGSASCGGKPGVSNTFASALWMLDTLFSLARVGVDGVNVHTFPGAAYAPFNVNGSAYPEYYGMLMFTRAFPPGARLLPLSSRSAALKAWATEGPGRRVRVLLINESSRGYRAQLRMHGVQRRWQLERLEAPSLDSTGGVTLGGPTFGGDSITVPAASAVLATQ
jgi:hypothetical protein